MSLNDFKISKEELEGMRLGEVIHIDDAEGLRRIKVRVKGVYDTPIKKEDIPYAVPLVDCRIPELGSIVAVFFRGKDIDQPYYVPRAFIDEQYIGKLLDLYKAVISGKEDIIQTNVQVFNDSFSEPDVGTTADFKYTKDVEIIPEDKAVETEEGVDTSGVEKAFMFEVDRESGKEQISQTHPTGTFIDIKPDGSIVLHSVKDEYNIVKENKNEVVDGNSLTRVKGKLSMQVDGVAEIKIGSATLVVSATGEVTLDAPKFQMKGAVVQCDGIATAGANFIKGPFNAIPACLFSGAAHISNKSLGN